MSKPYSAFAAIEFGSVPAGVYAADAAIKKSPISFVRSGTIGAGRQLLVFAGTTASVEEAFEEALYHGGSQVVDSVLLPDVHEALYAAIVDGKIKKPGPEEPVLVVETPSVSSEVLAVERALKGVPVELLEFRAGDPRMDGKGLAILQGDLYDVEAAQEIMVETLEGKGVSAQYRLLTAPHEALLAQLGLSTRFDRCAGVELEGEQAT